MSRTLKRIEKSVQNVTSVIFEKIGHDQYNGSINKDALKSRETIQAALGESASENEPWLKQLPVIGTEEDHTTFDLGNNNKPYVWGGGGSWIKHAKRSGLPDLKPASV